MTTHDLKQIEFLMKGQVTYRIGHGKSMEPVIMDGSRQTLIPILSPEIAKKLDCVHYEGQDVSEGELYYISPDEIQVGDAVFCKCKFIYTHEVHAIGGNKNNLIFYIGRHDKRRFNGWTKKVYGKCIRSEYV